MRSPTLLARRKSWGTRAYQLTDPVHNGRTARVGDSIASTVSAWLAELGARSPVVDDLGLAVRNGDWVTAHAIAERLSVDVSIAA